MRQDLNKAPMFRVGRFECLPGPLLIVSVLIVVMLLVSGAYVFRRMEKTFADVV